MLYRPPPLYLPSRRGLLRAGVASGVAAAMSRPARAVSASDRKFIFVFACGGWDPTRVLADGFDHDIVDMEADATRAEGGGLTWIDHSSRPSVTSFFERYASQTAFVHGLLVPSIAHEACFILSYTGGPSDTGTDWPSILGADRMTRYVAPSLVLGGPTFPGINLPAVVQTGSNGQLSDLMHGYYTEWASGVPGTALSSGSRDLIDTFVRARGEKATAGVSSDTMKAMYQAFTLACGQAEGLRARADELTFDQIATLDDSFTIATMALSAGISRVVSVCSPVNGERQWDSHVTNDDLQTHLFEDLFAGLLTLFDQLESLPGETTPTLLEETTVVVFSEMGRTPWLNGQGGKDHWPYTSAMLVGSGIRGGQAIGGYDEAWYGKSIDFATGELDEEGEAVSCGALGATLLALGNVDYAEHTGGTGPITALMS